MYKSKQHTKHTNGPRCLEVKPARENTTLLGSTRSDLDAATALSHAPCRAQKGKKEEREAKHRTQSQLQKHFQSVAHNHRII